MPSRPTARPRRPLRRIALVVLGMVAAVGSAELALRVIDPFDAAGFIERERFSEAILRRRPDGSLALRPGARATLYGHEVVINAQGLRNAEIEQPKPPGVFRVLMIGDSVAFGWGVAEEHCLPRVLESLWNAAGPPAAATRVEVINCGVPGAGMPNELLWLREVGLALDPDLVLVTLINNDLTDIVQALEAGPPAPAPLRLPDLLRATYVGRALEHGLAAAGGRLAAPDFYVSLDTVPAKVATASDTLCAGFAEMRRLCGDRPFAVIDTIGERDGSRRIEPFVTCANQLGLPRIDAFLGCPDYRERFSVTSTDDHPNAAGHRLMAEDVLAWVTARLR